MGKELIEFSQYEEIENRLDIRFGVIVDVTEVPKSSKLLKLIVDFGNEQRTVVTNIKSQLTDWASLRDTGSFFVMNLKPVKMMGIESEAMILPMIKPDGEFRFLIANDVNLRGSKLM